MAEANQIKKSAAYLKFERTAREQLDAFERHEYLIRMEERKERAAQLKLPVTIVPQAGMR